jgi:hypothetical protein
VTTQKAEGSNIISGQSLFAPDELAYIANHYIHVDHDQTVTYRAAPTTTGAIRRSAATSCTAAACA